MKKIIIFLVIIIALFGAIAVVNTMQQKQKSADNPYGKKELHPATVDQLDDPNYKNLILPAELKKKLDNKEDLTVYFYSSTCPHCKKTTPELMPLAKSKDIHIDQYNLQEFQQGWDDYHIEYTPTLVQFKDGKETARIVGYNEKEVFSKWFDDNSK